MAKTTKIDAIALKGRSGQSYDFRIYVWGTKFKAVAGVYVVASRSIEPGHAAKYEPLFVGAADDLSQTLNDHPRRDCFEMHYANVVAILRQDDGRARAEIVDDLQAGLAPPCNAADAE